MEYISEASIIKLAQRIKENVFYPVDVLKTSIILCGASLDNKESIRYKFDKEIQTSRFHYKYEVIYPEILFEELMYGPRSKDLLTLENMLAESVDVIVIIPESSGSIAELGAFSNVGALRNKIICIQDKKLKKKRSFINYGPIKLIKQSDSGKVIYIDTKNFSDEFYKITGALNKLKKVSTKSSEVISLVQIENYLLPIIYLLEPVRKDFLTKLVKVVSTKDNLFYEKTTTGISILMKKKFVAFTPSGYILTKSGFEHFVDYSKTGTKHRKLKIDILDEIRVDILNWKYRRKVI